MRGNFLSIGQASLRVLMSAPKKPEYRPRTWTWLGPGGGMVVFIMDIADRSPAWENWTLQTG